MRLILGIGQSLRGDDGAGPAAVKHWQSLFPARAAAPDLRIEILELPGLELLDFLAGMDQALLIDAVRSGEVPGTLRWLREADLADFGLGSGSAHGWGVAEALALGRQMQTEKMPSELAILGIEVGTLALGEGLSPEVASVMDEAALLIEGWVRKTGIDDWEEGDRG